MHEIITRAQASEVEGFRVGGYLKNSVLAGAFFVLFIITLILAMCL